MVPIIFLYSDFIALLCVVNSSKIVGSRCWAIWGDSLTLLCCHPTDNPSITIEKPLTRLLLPQVLFQSIYLFGS